MIPAHTPPGWPRAVRPPDAPAWERTAISWLLDHSPPELRGYPVLRRHPVALARFAATFIEASEAASRRGLAEARTSLRDHLDAEAIESAVAAWECELARLPALRREVALVEEALRGQRYRPRL